MYNYLVDYLDPRKRRVHRQRLAIGYVLMSIALVLGVLVLVYSAYGYGINTKTGDVVQNGLLFLDSKPGGADIYINGHSYGSKTPARLILPAGNYTVVLKRAGYHDWSRNFNLTEHTVSRYVYPLLFPLQPAPQPLKAYASLPSLATVSPDRRWLLIQQPSSTTLAFDEFDTTDLKLPPKSLALPQNLLAGPVAASQFKVADWSSDNKAVLLEHTYPGGSEFVVLNRANPAESFSINKTFSLNPTQVAMRNQKIDQFYLYDQTGTLSLGSVAAAQAAPILDHVLTFKTSGNDLIFYLTDQDAAAGQVWSRIWNRGKSYPLYSFTKGSHPLIDLALFQGNWYYAAGSDAIGRFNIYKNPLDSLANPAIAKALPLTSLSQAGADQLTFSDNARFLGAEAGQTFSVYDFENLTRYHYTLNKPLAGDLRWMDGHRLIGVSGGSVFVTDYDSTNQQLLVPAVSSDQLSFGSSYNHLFSLVSSPDGSTILDSTDLRAGADLPKQ